jgi:hypothetical protein
VCGHDEDYTFGGGFLYGLFDDVFAGGHFVQGGPFAGLRPRRSGTSAGRCLTRL